MDSNDRFKRTMHSKLLLSIFITSLIVFVFNGAWADVSTYFDIVQKTYIGYYQRPGDPNGLIYWATRLNATNGNLNEIIEAFANSAESQALYGPINSGNISTVVNQIYRALFGRDAEAVGLNYYVNGFNSGRFTAATIMLNVLNGAQNEDLQSVNNKLAAANLFTRTIDPELDGANPRVTYAGNTDAQKARDFLSTVTSNSGTVPTQAAVTAWIQNNIADPGDPIMNYVSGLLAGATNYIGSYPAAADVTFLDTDGVIKTVTAYPGQVQVFFLTSTSQSYAQTAIQSRGGIILSSIPLTGYYLVQVGIGFESAFISSIRMDPNVRGILPNFALELEQDGVVINEDYLTQHIPVPLNVHGPVAIDSGQHGLDVVTTAQENGGVITDIVNITELQDNKTPGDKWTLALMAIAQGNDIFNPGATTFINVSSGAGYRDDQVSGDTNGNGLGDWSDWSNLPPNLQQKAIDNRTGFMKNVLTSMDSLPDDLFNKTFLTMSGGNNNMPIDGMLSDLRKTPSWDAILNANIAIATCPSSLYNQANYGSDPSIVVMTNPQAAYGTSFAAPAANGAIQHLTAQEIRDIQVATGASFGQVVKAADLAKALNANNQVIFEEVMSQAILIVAPTCTYTYSDWSACQPNNTQSRTVISSSPAGCVGTPVLSQSCTYTQAVCGDGICDAPGGENATNCPSDCTAYCEDGICSPGESITCPQDCQTSPCCISTNNCPGETLYECGGTCCCCPYGSRCSNGSCSN